jgi:hypothetical protein
MRWLFNKRLLGQTYDEVSRLVQYRWGQQILEWRKWNCHGRRLWVYASYLIVGVWDSLLAKINNIWELRLKGRDLKIDNIKIMLNYLNEQSY